MKIVHFFALLLLISATSFAQTASLTGKVKNGEGQPIPLAFIRDQGHYYATYTDSAGSFILKGDPASSLLAIAPGYADIGVKIDGKASIDIVMQNGISSSAKTAVINDLNGNLSSLSAYLNKQTIVSQAGGTTSVKAGFVQEPTRGSPYLFTVWARGFAITNGDSLLYDVNNLYNYDKLTGNLVFTRDGKNILQANIAGVKSFSLFNGKPHPFVFVNAPEISKKPLIEILVATPRYKLYKQTDTKLQEANFHTDGVITSGNRYDEYEDNVHYFFVKTGDKPKQISLKKKTIKELFGGDADKFVSAQGDRDVDDDYLRDLNYALSL
ncbi:carboxypeptidase-like regulatory domain-containing protein [Mucilaginibacter sp. L3T2-6]|uniref:carboxypeptidase-like regulatory domain-containing protein n=1 Tax=Mucilaginibacter sp. L3T2-6 TaxID=3062491 RepID=UPI00267575D5|nr:carboxypeptidase-like regulatory domain-containing protein [Mucilaginibacter sp. L3T2-6]MDO3642305.1 carboxypeptidase-like regulatory domain-containing protein [Mucilaginibacter sp. L3T2-6]MDV6214800.1 carboxypeptidase-like regulatory domain-containing protein [Mucilaginibacter sp. L3T2-6]